MELKILPTDGEKFIKAIFLNNLYFISNSNEKKIKDIIKSNISHRMNIN